MYARPLGPGAQLVPLEPWRAAEFLANLDRCRTHIAPWVAASFVATDLASAETVLRRYWQAQAQTGAGIHGIQLDGVLVGGVMFVSLDPETGVAEVGCWLEPAAEGRGLVSRAIAVLIDWAFRERGIRRIIWHTRSANVRSINTARRLGLSFDSADEAGDAHAEPMEIWAVTADEWYGRRDAGEGASAASVASVASSDEEQVDAVGVEFLDAFTNADGRKVDLGTLESLFVPGAVIVGAADPARVESVTEFLAPRQELLTGGELTDFREWETSRTTAVSENVAQRLIRYAKSGTRQGVSFTGGGTKGMQFLRTPAGWRITGITWSDDAAAGGGGGGGGE
ncbi:GNAT family N-acetyltransferase [Embleya sp. AB8]|uniref:GNAT family N-acetyltransferase n=1 Tax=Embleya sp. AB8 TaxID=3156304 RepID=UPI003C751FB3